MYPLVRAQSQIHSQVWQRANIKLHLLGGILPAVSGYGGIQHTTLTSGPGTPTSFGGGLVPTNLNAGSDLTGISSTYEIVQQGLTANVTCSNYTDPTNWYPIEILAIPAHATLAMVGYNSGVFPVVNTIIPYMRCNSSMNISVRYFYRAANDAVS